MAIVNIENNRYTVDSLYQWDVNQKLEIRGLSLANSPEIHFSNTDMSRAIVRQTIVDDAGVITVDVPNSLLQKQYKINAYICIHEGDTFKSLYRIEIPVKARTKPSDYTIEDDEEIYSFNALENLVYDTAYNLTIKYNEALDIAKSKVTAKVFNTFNDMETWLSDVNNVNQLQVGDNLFIKALDSPDYWVSAVLTKPDVITGYYYNIAPLKNQANANNIIYNGDVRGDNVAEALDNAQNSIDELGGIIYGVKTLVCNVEEILFRYENTIGATPTNVYTYKATRKCFVNLTAMAFYLTSPPIYILIQDNKSELSATAIVNGEHSYLSATGCCVLEPGQEVKVLVKCKTEGKNTALVRGCVQYLE